MTQEEQDALVGRAIRESRAADEELQRLLVKAEVVARDLSTLSAAISKRVKRVREPDDSDNSTAIIGAPTNRTGLPSGARIERLSEFARVLDPGAIQTLDREIDEAEARASKLRFERNQLGV